MDTNTTDTPAAATVDPETEVLITGEVTKLPAAYVEYIDPQKPLPANVTFFEKKMTTDEMMKTVTLSGGIGCLGVISVLIGVGMLFDRSNVTVYQTTTLGPIFFGLTCLFAAWVMVQSLKTSRNLMRKQKRGEPTRVGIFLTPNTLFAVMETDYTIIPRSEFRGLGGAGMTMVKYLFKGQDKEFRLPGFLVRDDPAALIAAIQRWSVAPVSAGE